MCVPDLLALPDLDPLEREVAARLGYSASYAVPLTGTAEAARGTQVVVGAQGARGEPRRAAGTGRGERTEETAARTDTDARTGTVARTDRDAGTGPVVGTDTDAGTGPVVGTDTDAGTRPVVGTDTGARTDTGVHTDTDAGTGPNTGSGPETGGAATTSLPGQLGVVVWLYDEPAAPTDRQRHLVRLYARYAGEQLAGVVELQRARARATSLTEELLPGLLPRMPGVRLAARHRTGPLGGGDWYDALPLPEGALSLAVGSVSGSGPGAVAASGRLRACLRAYAVMEGEDPVAVLSDLELLLRLTEPARTATVLFAYAEPDRRRVVLAGAGHAPPLIVGDRRTEFVETSLSAPLTVLSCWQAPSVVVSPAPGETVLLYTEGLLRRTGEPMDRAFALLHAAAASVPAAARRDPGAIVDHVLRRLLPEPAVGTGRGAGDGGDAGGDDLVLLAARFD
ncbi:PP2C family protein-serine/threonine phosphatase [Streptomyces sp. NPDC012623]|uniref:PP2C family protein-serine/threonine phosphatase n=1 Tax=unclassified Streptomyces TaxID=2593676 RepID=UPI0036AE82DE